MKRRAVIFIIIGIAVIIIIAALAYIKAGPRPGPAVKAARPPAGKRALRTGRPVKKDFPVLIRWFGRAESKKSIKVVCLVPGRIITVDVGDERPVKKGTPLFTIGGPQVKSRMRTLEKKVSSLKKRLSIAGENAAVKEKALAERLVKRGELAASRDSMQTIESDLEGATQELRSLKAATLIRATIDGVFTGRRVSPGQDVKKGEALALLTAPGRVRVVAALFPPPSAALEGREASLHAPETGPVQGMVTKVLPGRTPEGATVVWIEGGEIDRLLSPGQPVHGEILGSVHRAAMAVPVEAIVRDEHEKTYLFIKGPEGWRKTPVKTGLVRDGWVEITEGLEDGEEVVTEGAYELYYRGFSKSYKVAD